MKQTSNRIVAIVDLHDISRHVELSLAADANRNWRVAGAGDDGKDFVRQFDRLRGGNELNVEELKVRREAEQTDVGTRLRTDNLNFESVHESTRCFSG